MEIYTDRYCYHAFVTCFVEKFYSTSIFFLICHLNKIIEKRFAFKHFAFHSKIMLMASKYRSGNFLKLNIPLVCTYNDVLVVKRFRRFLFSLPAVGW